MKKHLDSHDSWDELRDKIIGLGEHSGRKSYYPELQKLLYGEIERRKEVENSLRQTLEKLQELEVIVSQSPAIAFHWQAIDGWPIKYVSSNIHELGYDPEIFASGTFPYIDIIYPGDRSRVREELNKYCSEGIAEFTQEYRILKKNNEVRWIDARIRVQFDENGAATNLHGVIIDITKRKEAEDLLQQYRDHLEELVQQRTNELKSANEHLQQEIVERKQAEEALKRSEEKFRSIFENSGLGIFQTSPEGKILSANPAFARMLGYQSPEAVISSINDVAYDLYTDPAKRNEITGKIMKSNEPVTTETQFRCKNGNVITCNLTVRVVRDKSRQVLYFEGFAEDITERKQAEEALKDSERRLADIIDFPPDATFAIDREGRIITWNHAIEDLTSINAADMIGKDNYEYAIPFYGKRKPMLLDMLNKPLDEVRKVYENLIVEGDTLTADIYLTVLKPEGAYYWFKSSPLRNGHGKIVGAIESIRDITERKITEESLRENQRILSTLMSNIPGMAYRCINDQNWTMIFVSDGSLELTGYPPESLIGNAVISYADLIHPDDRQMVWDEVQAALVDDRQFRITYRIISAAGEEKWVWEQGRGIYSDDGKLLTLEGLVTDITERRRAEQALQTSEERLRLALTAGNQGTYDLDLRTGKSVTSPEHAIMLGYDPADFHETYHKWLNRVHPDDRKHAYEVFNAYIHDEIPEYRVEVRHITKSGNLKWILSTGKIVEWDSNGRPIRMVGVNTDITDLKRAEEALRFTQFAVDNLSDSAYWIEADANIIYVNKAACDLLGYTKEELQNMTLHDIDPDYTPPVWAKHWRELREKKVLVFETVHKTKDERLIPIEIVANFVEFEGREYNCAFARDITERKKSENALREVEAHKREFYRRTILAATNGKLEITEKEDIEKIAGPPIAVYELKCAADVRVIRNAIAEIIKSTGMNEIKADNFVLAVGEAITNAVKHAGGGIASIHELPGALIFMISDEGPGIEALTIPQVALVKGYTTAGTLGMGYKVIISVADKVYLATGPSGTTVAIEMTT